MNLENGARKGDQHMITATEFKKLMALDQLGYHVYLDGEEVQGLMYDTESDYNDFVDGCEEMLCNFTFTNDRYTMVQDLNRANGNWTVEKHEEIDWRNLCLEQI